MRIHATGSIQVAAAWQPMIVFPYFHRILNRQSGLRLRVSLGSEMHVDNRQNWPKARKWPKMATHSLITPHILFSVTRLAINCASAAALFAVTRAPFEDSALA